MTNEEIDREDDHQEELEKAANKWRRDIEGRVRNLESKVDVIEVAIGVIEKNGEEDRERTC